MKQQEENTSGPFIDRVIEDDRVRNDAPFLYTRIMQAIKNSRQADQPFLPPLFSRFALASIVIFLCFNLLTLFNAPDCPSSPEPAQNTSVTLNDPAARGLDYDNITDILLNQ